MDAPRSVSSLRATSPTSPSPAAGPARLRPSSAPTPPRPCTGYLSSAISRGSTGRLRSPSSAAGSSTTTKTMAEHASPGVSVVVDEVFDHPEGLLWDARQGKLLWVDIFAGLVLSHDLGSGPIQRWELGRAVGAVAPRQGDGGLVCAVR